MRPLWVLDVVVVFVSKDAALVAPMHLSTSANKHIPKTRIDRAVVLRADVIVLEQETVEYIIFRRTYLLRIVKFAPAAIKEC
mmetsp:Transcript_19315/g.48080  ORF Transcript_19315/g.48080 Transcript_19315/m.48080 type:complete len:82 (+) Transcript_19315:308-553(+)